MVELGSVTENYCERENPPRCGAALAPDEFAAVRRRTIFECCKWDPQVEDTASLASFPIILSRGHWLSLANTAEALAWETVAAERELLERPELYKRLGLPRAVCRAMRGSANTAAPGNAVRIMRFDFHPTPAGWRISEVNSDVPGGFIEASGFASLMAAYYPGCAVPACPAQAVGDAVLSAIGENGVVALVHATAYTDDRQVMLFLERELNRRGLQCCLVGPDQLRWSDGRASVVTDWFRSAADLILRFYPAEWLPNLNRACGWRQFFSRPRTWLCNPATSIVTQSKRFPLTWPELATPLTTWRAMLPETRAPGEVDWLRDENWVVKPALGRVGDSIGIRGITPEREWKAISRGARWFARHWVVQRRFEATPLETPEGARYLCIGVFTVNGAAAGMYGRLASKPLINERACDVAVLVGSGQASIRRGELGGEVRGIECGGS